MHKKYSPIFIFANLVDDRINGEHHLGGEASFVSSTIQILNKTHGKKIPYTLAGQVGNDSSGKFLITSLKKLNVDTSHLSVTNDSTCQAIIQGVKNAKFIGFEGGPICRFTSQESDRFHNELSAEGWIFLTSNTLYDNQTWSKIKKIIKKSPRLIFFDLNWREALLKRYFFSEDTFIRDRVLPVVKVATLLKGTTQELSLLYKYTNGRPKVSSIVETKGSQGAIMECNNLKYIQIAPLVKEIQDTGAGDTFSGSLLFDLSRLGVKQKKDLIKLSDADIKKILKNATYVSSLTVQGFGVNYLSKNSDILIEINYAA